MKALRIKKEYFSFVGIMYLYIVFLFFMPNDVFSLTSLKIFSSPSNITHYSITMAYVSLLYLPIIITGIFIYNKNRHIIKYDILSFGLLLLVKDIFISLSLGKSYMFKNSTYEMYWIYIVSTSIMAIVFCGHNTLERKFDFFELLGLITIATCIFSMLTGVGAGGWGYSTRYHASSMSSGETAFYLGMFSIYLSLCKDDKFLFNEGTGFVFKYRYILAMISIVLIFACGSRKDFMYAIAIVFLAKVLFVLKKRGFKIKRKFKKNEVLFFMTMIFVCIIGVLFFVKSNYIERLNLDRMIEPVLNIFKGNTKQFLKNDDSAEGRLESVAAGMNIIKHNFVTGLNFSFFNVQYNMQKLNYPTFPHSTLLFYWCMLGIFILVPVWMYAKYFVLLIKNKSSFVYVLFYVLIHSIISGGAYLDIKTIIQYMLVLSLSICICDKYKESIRFNNMVKRNKEISNE